MIADINPVSRAVWLWELGPCGESYDIDNALRRVPPNVEPGTCKRALRHLTAGVNAHICNLSAVADRVRMLWYLESGSEKSNQ